jgi:ABC-2 type transport system ATP-binding protein
MPHSIAITTTTVVHAIDSANEVPRSGRTTVNSALAASEVTATAAATAKRRCRATVNIMISIEMAMVMETMPASVMASASRTGHRRRHHNAIAARPPITASVQISQAGAPANPATNVGWSPSRSAVASTVKVSPRTKQSASMIQSRVDRRTGRPASGSTVSTAGSSQRYSGVVGVPTPVMLRAVTDPPIATKVVVSGRPRFAAIDRWPTRPARRPAQARRMITVDHLTKRYGHHPAVDDVSFTCAPGTVTGFLGPNGAGKSTTMRMICGLTPPTAGAATVEGVPYRRLGNPGRRVGVLLDASAQHSGRTGREVLTLAALTMRLDRRRVDESLDRVGLTAAAARKRVKAYSLGMRQRLGLAYALLGDPRVLILDEPANGLDPEGIFWMRGLLRDFADGGGTVLLSSHLLREVEAVADQLVVIGAGRIVAQADKKELLARSGTVVRALDMGALELVLRGVGLTGTTTTDGGVVVPADPETIGRAAADAGLVLLELRPAGSGGLEQMFLTLTAGKPKEAVR